ncbi:hypothetical protein DFH29DRAFT_849617 [Suillus ampliporus]|nr:hypothetical protein DFH29DRAFT_849617 [Suillus ampliporus]
MGLDIIRVISKWHNLVRTGSRITPQCLETLTTMFRSATVKIAHSSTIPVPALIGKEELRPLQDLIAAEKTVLTSLQRLSSDFSKAADAMRTWAISEGDDLSDILSSSRTLLAHFSGALNHYSSIQNVVRDNMKAVRTREESLDDLQRRRRRNAASVESIKKKLTRMNQETKAFGAQMDALNIACEHMRDLDAKIAHEESTIGAFKRKCTKNWLSLKFGGLAECCEKGMIVAEIGKRTVVVGGFGVAQDTVCGAHGDVVSRMKLPSHRLRKVVRIASKIFQRLVTSPLLTWHPSRTLSAINRRLVQLQLLSSTSFRESARRRLPHQTTAIRQSHLRHAASYLQFCLVVEGQRGVLAIEATPP